MINKVLNKEYRRCKYMIYLKFRATAKEKKLKLIITILKLTLAVVVLLAALGLLVFL